MENQIKISAEIYIKQNLPSMQNGALEVNKKQLKIICNQILRAWAARHPVACTQSNRLRKQKEILQGISIDY